MVGPNGFTVGTLKFQAVQQSKALQIRAIGQGFDANVTPAWIQARANDAVGAAKNALDSAVGQFGKTAELVGTYVTTPAATDAELMSAFQLLANQLGQGLEAGATSPGGTASWTNSDETPIEPDPTHGMRKGNKGIDQAAFFGMKMALASLAKGEGGMTSAKGATSAKGGDKPAGGAMAGGMMGNKA